MSSPEPGLESLRRARAETPSDESRRSGVRVTRPPRRWKTRVLLPGVVVLALLLIVAFSAQSVLRPAVGVEVAPVVLKAPAAGTPDEAGKGTRILPPSGGRGVTVQAAGWLEADPFYVAATALAEGVVEEVLVLEGERVEKGQVVARLVREDAELSLRQAEAEVERRRAELETARADLRAAETDWENPVERERAVATMGAMLNETVAELDQLPALIATERDVLERLEEELERTSQAVQSGAVNELELVKVRQDTDAQKNRLIAIGAREAILKARRDRLEAELHAAEENLRLRVEERRALDAATASVARAGAELTRAEAMEAEAQLRLDRMTIHAPISGLVQQRLKVPGDKVMFGMDEAHSAHIVHLYDPSMIQVRVDVPLADASHVYIGQACEVVVEVLPETTFRGEVTRITNEADLQKNTLQIKVRVLDPSPLLRPEMLTRVRFLPRGREAGTGTASAGGESFSGTMLVDERALVGGGSGVWIVRDRRGDRGKAERVAVELGSETDGFFEVRSGLKPGDLTIVSNMDRLSEDTLVRVRGGAR